MSFGLYSKSVEEKRVYETVKDGTEISEVS